MLLPDHLERHLEVQVVQVLDLDPILRQQHHLFWHLPWLLDPNMYLHLRVLRVFPARPIPIPIRQQDPSEVLVVRRIRLYQDLGLPKSPLPLWDLMHPPLDTLPQVGLMPMILNQVRPIPPRATVVITWIMS